MKNKCEMCGTCCKLFYINLSASEYNSGKYKTIFSGFEKFKNFKDAKKYGANFLAKNLKGDCVYLKNKKCSIHRNRPKVCRGFFCDSKNKKYKKMREIINMKGKKMKKISQKVLINASSNEVYNAFMDEKKHAKFTNASAKINNKVGGKFEVWDGYATGVSKILIPGKKIVQTWRASDWPENSESEITINLIPENNKTKLEFTQINIPDEFADDVKQGWIDYYWEPMKKMLEK